MNPEQYHVIQTFFKSYTDGFVQYAADPEPFELKIAHTHRVCENMEVLLAAQQLETEKKQAALAIALLHDIGRFLQYETYGTFNDMESENHGTLGVKVIREQKILSGLGPEEQRQIIKAVAVHNAIAVPDNLDTQTCQLVMLVRDADKVDILKVMADYYLEKESTSKDFITLHLPDDGQISPVLVQKILNHDQINARMVKTLNDLKLLQISWIFDVNFQAGIDLIRERGHIRTILSSLPASREVERVTATVKRVLGG